MQKQRKLFLFKATVLLAAPLVIWAFETGPDPGYTGAPNELGTCASAECHAGTANTGPGSVTISFADGVTSYTPGQTIRITVRVADPNQRRWGFQMTARRDGTSEQAGSFANISNQTQRICGDNQFFGVPCAAGRREYIEHTQFGTRAGTTTGANFEFNWTAPSTDAGTIRFYAAGNAANNDGSNSGDRIYTTSATLTPNASGPSITANGVVNAATFRPGISAGSYVTILGQNLATTTLTWDNAISGGELPRSLGGTVVKINGKEAYPSFVSPTQINVLAPADSAVGPVTVTVATDAGTSAAATATIQAVSPAFFIFNNDKYIAGLRQDFSLLGPTSLFPGATTPARPNEVVQLFGTGFGPTDPALPDGRVVTGVSFITARATATVGGQTAGLLFGGVVPPFANLYQLNIQIPESLSNGDHEVIVTVNGVSSPTGAVITVQR